jgi:hypothetical protein
MSPAHPITASLILPAKLMIKRENPMKILVREKNGIF